MNYLVEGGKYWLNVFPSNSVLSNTIVLAVIFLGRPQPYFNIKGIAFREYSISYSKTKNDMKSKVITLFALR